jgi:hypothetical protein
VTWSMTTILLETPCDGAVNRAGRDPISAVGRR